MRLHRFRAKYWNCTKFADLVRGKKKPHSETLDGWVQFREDCLDFSMLRYWLAEEGLNIAQNIIYYPADLYNAIKFYIDNRFISKTNSLTASKDHIKPGEYCDLRERLLICCFDELVKFVESKNGLNCFGLDFVEWETELTDDSGNPTHQALAAKKQLELYSWWKFERPKRDDSFYLAGVAEYDRKALTRNEWSEIYEYTHDKEKQYEYEDSEKLKELVSIRLSLWD